VTGWRVEPTEPVLAGHYPGFPILPGVYLVEHAHQVACGSPPEGADLVLTGVDSARFLAPVLPGDVVRVDLAWSAGPEGWGCRADVHTGRGPVASVRLRYAGSSDFPAPQPFGPIPRGDG
jgi:3-hydroxyacyl-[acyl-carrier-protein] dehydratase